MSPTLYRWTYFVLFIFKYRLVILNPSFALIEVDWYGMVVANAINIDLKYHFSATCEALWLAQPFISY